jgi:hypothetical protein
METSPPTPAADAPVHTTGMSVSNLELDLDPFADVAKAAPIDGLDVELLARMAELVSDRQLGDERLDDLAETIARTAELPAGRIVALAESGDSGKAGMRVMAGGAVVAALKRLARRSGSSLHPGVFELLTQCPVTVITPGAHPALALAAVHEPIEVDGPLQPFVEALRDTAAAPPSAEHVAAADLDSVGLRYLRGWRCVQQLLIDPFVGRRLTPACFAVVLAAMDNVRVRSWLGWDDPTLSCTNRMSLAMFARLVAPAAPGDKPDLGGQLCTDADVVVLADVLGDGTQLELLLRGLRRLQQIVEDASRSAEQHALTQMNDAVESLKWDQRRFNASVF